MKASKMLRSKRVFSFIFIYNLCKSKSLRRKTIVEIISSLKEPGWPLCSTKSHKPGFGDIHLEKFTSFILFSKLVSKYKEQKKKTIIFLHSNIKNERQSVCMSEEEKKNTRKKIKFQFMIIFFLF